MSGGNEQMLEMFLFEMTSLLDQLDEILLSSEKSRELTEDSVNEIFRIMHTIKGSSAMMEFSVISTLTHRLEDTFFLIRENGVDAEYFTELFDLMLESGDFLRSQLDDIQNGMDLTPNDELTERAIALLDKLKGGPTENKPAAPPPPVTPAPPSKQPDDTAQQYAPEPGSDAKVYDVEVFFEEDCGMENLRAFMLIHTLKANCVILEYDPSDIESNPDSTEAIMINGFNITLETELPLNKLQEIIEQSMHVKSATVTYRDDAPESVEKEGYELAEPGNRFEALIRFEEDCGMENLRAFMLVNSLRATCRVLSFAPAGIETDPQTAAIIMREGLRVTLETALTQEALQHALVNAMYVKDVQVVSVEASQNASPNAVSDAAPTAPAADSKPVASSSKAPAKAPAKTSSPAAKAPIKQSLISVSLDKLDRLMDLMGELVITESMVVRSPDLKGIAKLDNFQKSERQLRKLTDELQDMVMSIRMIPVSATFQKMQRIVRDMCHALNKEADLVTMGEETDIDKTIIDNIGDPIMHLVRNSMDHGIESPAERVAAGKPSRGTVTLSAQNTGGEILITVSDDGGGIDAEQVLAKAKKQGILTKPANEYSDKEAFQFLFHPGFSTNEVVTEFSGRGVGMDVVKKNIEKVGGTVSVESKKGYGSSFFLKIPLTLAIVDGMDISVGGGIYTLQITAINESFKATKDQIIVDTEGNEMIVIRGNVYPIVRLHELYSIPDCITDIEEGILIWVQSGDNSVVLFADQLIGEQQIVVKAIPSYLSRFNVKPYGISGCTILGDGNISLILDVGSIIETVLEKR